MNRRGWLAAAGGALLLGWPPPAPSQARAPHRAPALPIRFGLIAGEDVPEGWRLGARLGVEEAEDTAALLGTAVEAVEPPPAAGGPAARVRELPGAGVRAVVAAAGPAEWPALEAAAAEAGVLLLDARATHGATERCRPLVFRTGAAASPGVLAAGEASADGGPAELLAWHPSLDRYGAEQLNQRFETRFDRPMDGHAWAAWVAVKVLVESALRVGGMEPAALAAHLASAHFDGHKGRPLRFGPDGRLEHPLYRAGSGGVVVQVEPTPGAACAGARP